MRRLVVVIAIAMVCVLACGSGTSIEDVRNLQKDGKHQAAIEPLRALMKADPEDPEIQFRYGLALATTGRGGLAIWPLRKAMESPQWRKDAATLLATTMLQSADWDGTIRVTSEFLEEEADNPKMLSLRGRARLGSRRDYEGALADGDKMLELDPDDVEGLKLRTMALLGMARVEEAEAALQDLDDRYRDETLALDGSPVLCVALATFAMEKGEIDLADKRFDECAKTYPSDPVVLKESVEYFDKRGRGERALEIVKANLEGDPGAHHIRLNLAARLRAAGKPEEATELMRAATQLPDAGIAAEGWINLAGYLIEIGDYDEGLAAYEEVLRRIPDPGPELTFAFADALILSDRLDRALELAETKLQNDAHKALVRGRVALARNQPGEALKQLEAGIRLWPDNAVARYYAALAAERLGDFDRALEHYRYAVRADPQLGDAALRLGRLYIALGRESEAYTAMAISGAFGPERIEMGLLMLEIGTHSGWKKPPTELAERFNARELWARAAVARARGIDSMAGAEDAVRALKKTSALDLTHPMDVAALDAMLGWLVEAGQAEEARALADAALAAHPEFAAFHALKGRLLAAQATAQSESRAAFEKALELDPRTPVALRGLAALEASAGNAEAAVALYDRAIEVEPAEESAPLAAAALLQSLGKPQEAEKRLEALLRERPWNADAALALARLRVARGDADARTRELARRAVRFHGGSEAKALLSELQAQAQARSGSEGMGDEPAAQATPAS